MLLFCLPEEICTVQLGELVVAALLRTQKFKSMCEKPHIIEIGSLGPQHVTQKKPYLGIEPKVNTRMPSQVVVPPLEVENPDWR